jgi:competence protein ComEA
MRTHLGFRAALACMALGLSLPCVAQTSPAPAKPQTVAQKIAANQLKLDLNTATPAQLKALPGMGDNYVTRVIAGRPYTAKNQLVQRGILPPNVYAGISDLIVAHRPKK